MFPPFRQNMPLLYELLKCWDISKEGFIIKGNLLKFIANEVALLTEKAMSLFATLKEKHKAGEVVCADSVVVQRKPANTTMEYGGKEFHTQEQQSFMDDCFKKYNYKNIPIFSSGNVVVTRGHIDELITDNYLTNDHVYKNYKEPRDICNIIHNMHWTLLVSRLKEKINDNMMTGRNPFKVI
ncbi:hypothetical protein IEQ34_003661 [Dendrobium chrysotoxum]|uniref:LAGLIDADG homing endonuclease n=1 Tax=Dendrobium chrysotoxum TaxID=161865 RepID=A0AAV7HEC9_DENCH|nr:hypothetical protein IEQ34_003661 [Dendrobium chrysotoxum]